MSTEREERTKPWTGATGAGRRRRTAVAAAVVALSSIVVAPQAAAASSSLSEFEPCEENRAAWCATLSVPERWDAPDGGPTIDLRVVKRATTARGDAYRGVLLVDAGGPDGTSARSLEGNWYDKFTEPVRDAFDIVAIDEREGRITCQGPRLNDELPPAPDHGAFHLLASDNDRYARSCRPAGLKEVDSLDRARDLDALRRGLGVDVVSFYGVSYGTVAGQALAELFPGTVRSMVLDSPQYPRLSTRDYLITAAAATEDVAHGFARWCQAHQFARPMKGSCRTLARVIRKGLGITAEQVLDHLARLRSLAEAGKLRDDQGKPVSPDELTGVFSTLHLYQDNPGYLEQQAGTLATWRAGQREVTTTRTLGEPTSDSQVLLRCNDFFDRTITTDEQWRDLWRSSREVAPTVRTSAWHWTWMRACLGTDLGEWRPRPFPAAVPLVVTSMRYDSATPQVWARRLAASASAPLVSYDGFGHGAYDATIEHRAGPDCVARPVERFLLDGVEPVDARCQGRTAVPGS